MELDPEWWRNPLAADIHNALRDRELTLPRYNAQSPQLHHRRSIIDWLALVCDSFKICSTARHLAVYLLDYFMDSYDIDEQQLHLVALGALLVSSKFEEIEVNIPKAPDLDKHVPNNSYSLSMYIQMELVLLKCFDWNVYWPTPAHFVDYYLTESTSKYDLHKGMAMPNAATATDFVIKYTEYFLEISLQDEAYRGFHPSVIAASCIGASRLCLYLSPEWPCNLEKLTTYIWSDLQSCIHLMMMTHQYDTKREEMSRIEGKSCSEISTPPSSPIIVTTTAILTPISPGEDHGELSDSPVMYDSCHRRGDTRSSFKGFQHHYQSVTVT